MHRRDFLLATAAAGLAPRLLADEPKKSGAGSEAAACGPGYASPQEAIRAPREKLLYTIGLYVGTDTKKPDYLATIDVDPASPTYGKVIHRLPMTHVGDELHHFGWNACSSCHAEPGMSRRYLVIPGQRSSRIYIVDMADPRKPKHYKAIEPEVVKAKANLSAPHTVHCTPDGGIMISMLGDADGNGPGGFLVLDDRFDIVGHWERDAAAMKFNYDFWYQPRHNVMVSSEWSAPKTYYEGFKLDDVGAGKYGSQVHFWDWKNRRIEKTVDLGDQGRIPLEVRFHHNPDSSHGFVGAALSSTMWHWHKDEKSGWQIDKVIEVPTVEAKGWPIPVPGLITDLVLSMDDRYLYFSNWLHGDIRQYDVSDPAKPKLAGQLWIGGVLGKGNEIAGRKLVGGPQMLQLSLDGRRLYVTSSLFSSWDNQFYPDMAKTGSFLLQVDCDPAGGMNVNDRLLVDFGREPDGPARAHEMRYPGGDCTSDIWT
ncbi:MAG: selenium-binding family protein [Planctomycetia bacterium]|nr:selenium-binding family protein [Planctomycetia bacterium]